MKNILNIGILIVLTLSCSKSVLYNSVQDKSECVNRGGYWYNNKCWKDFEDEGIPIAKVDSVVSAEMKIIEKSKFIMDDITYPLVNFLPIEEGGHILLIAVYATKENYKTLILPTGKKKISNEIFKSTPLLFLGDALSGVMEENPVATGIATINVVDIENLDIKISGNFSSTTDNKTSNFTFKSNESISGAGSSHIEIKENEAHLSGDLGTITYAQIKDLIKNNPEVKTIVMTRISGSVNDAVNMHTGRLIRENGFTTKVLLDSDIASGGVDLFCAGKKRVVEKGAKIGIHSWCCVDDLTAIEIPKEHPAHKYQLEYFTMALGVDKGSSFYFYTLEAAAFDSIYYMTDEEIKKWGVATDFIEDK